MLSQMSIAKRLYLVSFVLIFALGIVAIDAWVSLKGIKSLVIQTEEKRVPQLMQIAAIELNVTRTSLLLRHAILARTPEELDTTFKEIKEKRQIIDATLKEFESGVFTDEGRTFINKFKPVVGAFWVVGEKNIQLISEGKKDEAFEFLVNQTIPARNILLVASGEEKTRQSKQLKVELGNFAKEADTTSYQIVGLVMLVAIGLTVFSGYLARVLRSRVQVSQQIAERVRDGDLVHSIDDDFKDEFSPLLASLKAMQKSLTQIVTKVRNSSDGVASSSAEIASGNEDLSTRTEAQGHALDKTIDAMAQLSSTVRQNADNAQQANQLASSAAEVAANAGKAVSEVVETMKGINAASNKISDIISVIDSIAFQTNILALNAAVEAARAGEQGRGFAVVASEVRNLAGRSANAAKEIKQLISDSVERVNQGSALVDQAGTTMEKVVRSISRVNLIMAEISNASAEQSHGVVRVGEAVNDIESSTQQNAALVEEMSSAALSLRTQAQELITAVSAFKLP
ncbi:MCP four helix bundle domain-containing protein [Undibacterium seohonense]|uniref:MCP four helix bundle domain-containing protein n=1 Tax=Undibacterium seohonense TaxID=1344950 RepID=A0ABR6X399_9BURK|nr:methyl-accepting chemotaxis protein [Undibacterium seohonense]MBC3807423.1 MCP four helix bundle domain-containing protein [Undibacterium seohonense]